MAKRIVAKTGSFTNQQNEVKGEYTKLGVILSNDNGEYMLLDPSVSLTGVLIKQNALAAKSGGQQRDMLMVSIFEDDNQQQNNNQGQQQNNHNFNQQQNNQQNQGGFGQPQQPPMQQGNYQNNGVFEHNLLRGPLTEGDGGASIYLANGDDIFIGQHPLLCPHSPRERTMSDRSRFSLPPPRHGDNRALVVHLSGFDDRA